MKRFYKTPKGIEILTDIKIIGSVIKCLNMFWTQTNRNQMYIYFINKFSSYEYQSQYSDSVM